MDDGKEPTGWEGYVDYPANDKKDLAARFYIYVERDPEKAAALDARQNAAILEILQWIHDNKDELGAGHPEVWREMEQPEPPDLP